MYYELLSDQFGSSLFSHSLSVYIKLNINLPIIKYIKINMTYSALMQYSPEFYTPLSYCTDTIKLRYIKAPYALLH